jgi:branched-chain amino acid transport system substrate-binding protein
MAKWIKANSIPTILGKKSWDAKGDLTSAAYVVSVYKDDGTYVRVSK